jgi:iron complex transport system ATP-binding protein
MSLLDVSDLSVRLGGAEVVRNVSLSVERGELVGLIGPNGAGKSTLLKALLGLLPCNGEIRLAGQDAHRLSAREKARLIAYLPQERETSWSLRTEAIVWLGRMPHRGWLPPPEPADRDAVDRAMRQTDTTHLRKRFISEISGGERARVLIARALAQDAPLLLADEPTAGLDPAHQIALMEIFTDLANAGHTVIVTLHELHLAARWCERLLLLDQGSLRADGKPVEVLTERMLDQVYGVDAYIAMHESKPIVLPVCRTERAM